MGEIAGLGVRPFGAVQVFRAGGGREGAEFGAPGIVQQPDVQPIRRPVHSGGGEEGGPDDLLRFVDHGDKDVDSGPGRRVVRHLGGLAAAREGGLDVAENHADDGVEFGGDKADGERGLPGGGLRHRLGQSPEEIAQRRGEGEGDEAEAGPASGDGAENEGGEDGACADDRLVDRRQWQDGDEGHDCGGEQDHQHVQQDGHHGTRERDGRPPACAAG